MLLKALARLGGGSGMLDEGVYTSGSEIGAPENISKGYVSRIVGLASPAPDTLRRSARGTARQSLMLESLERPLAASWEEQRRKIFAASGYLSSP
jgi:hypothetical protein